MEQEQIKDNDKTRRSIFWDRLSKEKKLNTKEYKRLNEQERKIQVEWDKKLEKKINTKKKIKQINKGGQIMEND